MSNRPGIGLRLAVVSRFATLTRMESTASQPLRLAVVSRFATLVICEDKPRQKLRLAVVSRFATLDPKIFGIVSAAAACGRLSFCYTLGGPLAGNAVAAACGRLSFCYTFQYDCRFATERREPGVLISIVLRIIASVNHVLAECGQWDRRRFS